MDDEDPILLRRRQRQLRFQRRVFVAGGLGFLVVAVLLVGFMISRSDREYSSGHGTGSTVDTVSIDDVVSAYRASTAAGDARFKNKRLEVVTRINSTGNGWAGTYALLSEPTAKVVSTRQYANNAYSAALRGATDSIVFVFDLPSDASRCKSGMICVIEGVCEGIDLSRPETPKITFTHCRFVREKKK